MQMNTWTPLYSVEREGLEEIAVSGGWAAWSGDRVIQSVSGDALVYGRSLMKPFQMKVFVKELDGLFGGGAKALSVASHTAQPLHLALLESMVDEATESHRHVASAHPCSGKHTAVLRGCEVRGWPLDSYLSVDHPYHQALVAIIQKTLGASWQPRFTATDGCGLPTMSMTLTQLAQLYAALARDHKSDWIFGAMTGHPLVVGGTNRLDSTIMSIGQGRILAKEGADGLLGLAIRDERFPEGVGIVIKIASGYDQVALAQVAREMLRGFGVELLSTDLFRMREISPRATLSF